MKTCNLCKQELEESFFYKMKNRKDGLMGRCKKCHNKSDAVFKKRHPERAKEIHAKATSKRNLAGKCNRCNTLRMPSHKNLCEKHWYRERAQHVLKDGSKWELLKQLAEIQNFKCVYTNQTLVPGINMSIDHIIPFAKGGKHELENLQWVALEINYMKRDMEHKRFLEICEIITNKFKDKNNDT